MSRPDNADVLVYSSDNHKFCLHSSILQIRWPLYKRDPNDAIRKLSKNEAVVITAIIEYIYGGLPAKDNMKRFFESVEVPFPSNNFLTQYKLDMHKLFSSHIGSDFTIESHGERFNAHKYILSIRSGYFSSLLSSKLFESRNGIYVDNFSDSSVHMKQFLEYLYTGETKCVTIEDNLSLLSLCKEFSLYENYEGEADEYVMSNLLKSHGSQMNEIASRARSKNFDKLLNLIDACGTEI